MPALRRRHATALATVSPASDTDEKDRKGLRYRIAMMTASLSCAKSMDRLGREALPCGHRAAWPPADPRPALTDMGPQPPRPSEIQRQPRIGLLQEQANGDARDGAVGSQNEPSGMPLILSAAYGGASSITLALTPGRAVCRGYRYRIQ
jgi:hypothetical protein